MGCFKQGAGAQMTMLVNDSGPNSSALGQEAWVAGWEQLYGLTSSVAFMTTTGSAAVGTGIGQFPLAIQTLSGNVIWRKSSAGTNVGRYWILFADSSSMYFFVQTGDTTGVILYGNYLGASFGDIYSLKGNPDTYRCLITGRVAANNAGIGVPNGNTFLDCFDGLPAYATNNNTPTIPTTVNPFQASVTQGHYMPRTWGGSGPAIPVTKVWDTSKMTVASSVMGTNYYYLWWQSSGLLQTPNGPDNSIYVSPVLVVEPSPTNTIRGRWRGIYQLCHPIANFSDGQVIQGSGDYAGKTFQIIKTLQMGGALAIEISPTLETN
jgi:hypothetical protein